MATISSSPLPRYSSRPLASAPKRSGVDILRLALLGLTIYLGSIILLDFLYNVFFILTFGIFILSGVKIDRTNMPFIFYLVVYNLGALIAYQPYIDFDWSREFVIGTGFVATTAIFYCILLNEDTLKRLEIIRVAYIVGALQASVLGIIGYANIGGLGEIFSLYGRASGTFRDPNVFGPFLVLPALYLLWDLINGGRWMLIKGAIYTTLMAAILLSFSRGAWGSIIIGTALMLVQAYATSTDTRLRYRIVAGTLIAGVVMALIIVVALSIDDVAKILQDRFVLQKDYDSGPSGRFGNQKRSIPDLLTRPFGHGPNRFGLFYPENPHNVYLMAFSSYGWIGGLTFLAFIASTLYVGAKSCFMKTPFQAHSIIIFSALVPHILQGFQIDSDRWRHLFLLYGLTWGLAGVSRKWTILNRRRAVPGSVTPGSSPTNPHRPLPVATGAVRP